LNVRHSCYFNHTLCPTLLDISLHYYTSFKALQEPDQQQSNTKWHCI